MPGPSRKRSKTRSRKSRKHGGSGAIHCDALINTHMNGLLHGTSLGTFEAIVKTGKLLARAGDNILLRGRPLNKGVFLQPLWKCNATHTVTVGKCDRPIFLVFSNVLFNKYEDYHISTSNCGGMTWPPALYLEGNRDKAPESFPVRSYRKDQLREYFEKEAPLICKPDTSLTYHEIVFNEDISFDDLQEVWVCGYEGPFEQFISRPATEEERKTKRQEYIRERMVNEFHPTVVQERIKSLLDAYGFSRVTVRLINHLPEGPYTQSCDE